MPHQRGQLAHIIGDGRHHFSRAETQTRKQTQKEKRSFQDLEGTDVGHQPSDTFRRWNTAAGVQSIILSFNLNVLTERLSVQLPPGAGV